MQEEKNKKDDQAGAQQGELGRTNHRNDPADISTIDRQEGNLEHGEKGGNFNASEEEESNDEK